MGSVIIMTIIMLFQSLFSPSLYANEKNYIIYFSNKQEIYLFDLESKTSRKLLEVKERGYTIDYKSIRSIDGKVFLIIQDNRNARFSTIPDSITNTRYMSFQTGTVYKKEYMIDFDGNQKLLRTTEIVALNPGNIEIREMVLDDQTRLKVYREDNRNLNIIGPETFNKVVEKNGIKISVINRSLFIQKKGSDQKQLILADKKVNDKIAYGCQDPYINNNGTKGLCSYFSYPWGNNKEDKSAIIEINLLTNQIIKYTDIVGFEPSFSPDNRFILYKSSHQNRYEIYNVHKKSIFRLPKSVYALWLN